MTLIKKIIMWLIELFYSLLGKKRKIKKFKVNLKKETTNKKKNKAGINTPFDEELPSYMFINDRDKEKLIYSLSLMKKYLEETNEKRKEVEERKIVKYLEDKYNIKIDEITSPKILETIIKDIEVPEKKEIISKYNEIVKRDEDFKVHIDKIDKVINEINKQEISIIKENEIDREISKITTDKNIQENTEEKVDYFNKNVIEIVDNIDEEFIKEVVREYNKVNYVTVSTMIIDKNYERFKKLQEDFKNHRYNKYYYEREINKIKHELNQIKSLKNNKEVSEHIEKLKKELYTKSKDKYDLLYNNELFMNFNKECDLLLDKINAKVIDIKKEEKKESKEEQEKKIKKEQEEQEEINKRKYLDNILLRFQDMTIARDLIKQAQDDDNLLILDNKVDFISRIYQKYNSGIEQRFNFDRNRQKTELVILYNELNMAISKETKEPFISIDHINFRMEDLVEAVEVKKEELKLRKNLQDSPEELELNEKLELLVPKKEKKLKK